MGKPREKAYSEGRTAAFYGVPKDQNPYTPFTAEYGWWNDGWDDLTDEENDNLVGDG